MFKLTRGYYAIDYDSLKGETKDYDKHHGPCKMLDIKGDILENGHGKRHGKVTTYYGDGKEIHTFVDGKRHGTYAYIANRTIIKSGCYRDDKKHGKFVSFLPGVGKIVHHYNNGTLIKISSDNGETLTVVYYEGCWHPIRIESFAHSRSRTKPFTMEKTKILEIRWYGRGGTIQKWYHSGSPWLKGEFTSTAGLSTVFGHHRCTLLNVTLKTYNFRGITEKIHHYEQYCIET